MPSIKVIDVVSAIHKRVREQAASYESPTVLEDWSNDLAKLHSAYNTAYCARNLVGSVPQLPNTFLGIAAGWVIGIAQRMLFWYTPQIRYFNEATTSVLNRVCSLEERKFRVFLAMADRLEKLERETGLLRAAQSTVSASARPADPARIGPNGAVPEPPAERRLYAIAYRHQGLLLPASGAVSIQRAGGYEPAGNVSVGNRQSRTEDADRKLAGYRMRPGEMAAACTGWRVRGSGCG